MGKYLIKGNYTPEGTKGLLNKGGSQRKAVVEKMVNNLGGTIEAFYYAFGDPDIYVIVDMPDVVTATAISLVVNASGAVQISTIPLITPEQVDQACKKSIEYSPPGS